MFCAEHSFEKFPVYTSRGIIMASIDELRRDFTRLVGYHDAANELTSPEENSPSKGRFRRAERRQQNVVIIVNNKFRKLLGDVEKKNQLRPNTWVRG